jgi:N6-adenosine-specific RNA methylase IME4
VCGMPKPQFVEANVASARSFTSMPPAEMDRLRERLAGERVALESFFADHHDGRMAWG